MSELNNPLFEDQKEFLERQKQEYKNALLNDVTDLKQQSQKIGKTVLIAGGALAGVWLVSTMFRGKKKSSKRLKTGKAPLLLSPPAYKSADDVVQPDGSLNYADALHQAPGNINTTAEYAKAHTTQTHEPSALVDIANAFFQSDMAKALTQQLTAFLLVYLTKKAEEYLQEPKNSDIAVSNEPETRDIDFSYHEEDAV
ncbi:hypothetical protein AAE02nite_10900 [Adhaeribacter aerolatus]|uniref:Uncharacterized protein n=1 Tax=Adhaeribacter aerolatus TaxID=670289 RepID=A0A512AUN3_9BACT|nr:hypothetical protein [Adhaeribacter aerolatus]GEO03426.1 hypothetical protein AAE02nite_10900 [Adhaeribacter aerolatus]